MTLPYDGILFRGSINVGKSFLPKRVLGETESQLKRKQSNPLWENCVRGAIKFCDTCTKESFGFPVKKYYFFKMHSHLRLLPTQPVQRKDVGHAGLFLAYEGMVKSYD